MFSPHYVLKIEQRHNHCLLYFEPHPNISTVFFLNSYKTTTFPIVTSDVSSSSTASVKSSSLLFSLGLSSTSKSESGIDANA